MERKNLEIRTLKERTASLEEELEELHEKQEKIIGCIFVEKQSIDKKLNEALKYIEDLEKKNTSVKEGLEESLSMKDEEAAELRRELSLKTAEIDEKDFQLKQSSGKVSKLEKKIRDIKISGEKKSKTNANIISDRKTN